MKYLKGTTRRRLMYTKTNNPLVSYSNVVEKVKNKE
jgi:hypothetical protein